MEITAEMHRAGLAAFEEWRAAPLGVGHGDVVSRVLTAALGAVPAFFPALPAPVAQPIDAEPAHEIEDAIGLVAQDGAETEPKADAEEDPPHEAA